MTKITEISHQTDTDLIEKYKNGNGNLAELYRRYSNLVLGSCLKHFKNKADAEDAKSEIFEIVRSKLKSHEVSHFKSWLYTVTKNYCIEQLRTKSRKRDKLSNAERVYSEYIFHPDDVKDPKLLEKLYQCIDLLPTNQQKTIHKFYFEKIGYKDIATQMNISWDKVRSFIQNGRRNLKNCIDK